MPKLTISIDAVEGGKIIPLSLAGELRDGCICIPFEAFGAALAELVKAGSAVTLDDGQRRVRHAGRPVKKAAPAAVQAPSPAVPKPAAPKPAQPKVSTTTTLPKPTISGREIVAQMVRDFGPLTRSEIMARCMTLGLVAANANQAIYAARDAGQIEQFDDEKNGGLTKWRIKN